MKNRLAIVLAIVIGAASQHVPWPQSQTAYAVGSTTTFVISSAGDRSFLFDTILRKDQLKKLARNVVSSEAAVIKWTALRDAMGDRVRRRFAEFKTSFDNAAPADIREIEYGFGDTNGDGLPSPGENSESNLIRAFFNQAAIDARVTPPAGVVVFHR